MADVPAVPEPTEEEAFEFLDELRESGRTNMFGASQYIESEFDFAPERAKELLAS